MTKKKNWDNTKQTIGVQYLVAESARSIFSSCIGSFWTLKIRSSFLISKLQCGRHIQGWEGYFKNVLEISIKLIYKFVFRHKKMYVWHERV